MFKIWVKIYLGREKFNFPERFFTEGHFSSHDRCHHDMNYFFFAPFFPPIFGANLFSRQIQIQNFTLFIFSPLFSRQFLAPIYFPAKSKSNILCKITKWCRGTNHSSFKKGAIVKSNFNNHILHLFLSFSLSLFLTPSLSLPLSLSLSPSLFISVSLSLPLSLSLWPVSLSMAHPVHRSEREGERERERAESAGVL